MRRRTNSENSGLRIRIPVHSVNQTSAILTLFSPTLKGERAEIPLLPFRVRVQQGDFSGGEFYSHIHFL